MKDLLRHLREGWRAGPDYETSLARPASKHSTSNRLLIHIQFKMKISDYESHHAFKVWNNALHKFIKQWHRKANVPK